MELILSAVADAANVSQEGKLNILGIFRDVHSTSFPYHHPSMVLVLVLQPRASEKGTRQKIRAVLVDQDGNIAAPLEAEATLPMDLPEPPPQINLVLNLVNTEFLAPGPFRFDLFINDHHVAEVPIRVMRLPIPPS